MTFVAWVAVVVAVIVVVGALAVGWMLGRRSRRGDPRSVASERSRSAPTTTVPPGASDLTSGRSDQLLAPGTAIAQGRLSKAGLLALVVQTAETGIAVVDQHRDVVLFNQRATRLGLVTDHQLDEQAWAAAHTVLQTGIETDVELEPAQHVNGFISTGRALSPPVAVRCLIRLVTDGVERYAVVYGTDDSDNVRLEATRRDFVANVSHELKTPVGSIGLLTEALLESHDDPDAVRHFGRRVITESTRMGNMVNELIALSRLQGAEKLPETDDVSVDELIDEAVHRAQVGADAAGITLHTDPASGFVVRGDHTLLLTALNNLIANAIAYSPANTTVSVSRRLVECATQAHAPGTTVVAGGNGGGPMVAIAVTDRGIGIAKRDHQRVFERFFRVDKARSRATGGTGLGLAIVKHVAANHDGSITLWSRPGTGSTFTIAIPMVRTPAADRGTHGRRRTNPEHRVLETKENR